jgi:WD40 repeat protein
MAEFEAQCTEFEGKIKALNEELAAARKPAEPNSLVSHATGQEKVDKKHTVTGAGVLSFTQTCGKLASLSWLDDDNLATVTQDGKVVVHAAKFGKGGTMRWYRSQATWLMTSEFSPDGTKLAVGGLDNLLTIHNFDIEQDQYDDSDKIKPFKVCEKHGGYIGAMKWVNDTTCITGSGDRSILRWDLTQPNQTLKEPAAEFKGHEGDVCGLDVVDENLFVSGSGDTYCKLWDARVPAGNGCVTTFAAERAVNGIKMMEGFQAFAAGLGAGGDEDEGCVKLFDIRSQKMMNEYNFEGEAVTRVCFSKSNRMLFSGFGDGTVKCTDVLTGDVVWSDSSLSGGEISALCLSRGGSAVAAGMRQNGKNFSLFI